MKKLLLLVIFLIAPHAHAAIPVFGAINQVAFTTTATETTGTITVSGSNTLGLLFIYDLAAASSVSGTPSWNGSNMTLISTKASGQGTDYIYCIVAPTTGTATATRGSNLNSYSIQAVYYTGVNQSCTVDAINSLQGTGGATVTSTVTPVSSSDLVISSFKNDSGAVSLSSGGTLRGSVQATQQGMADSNLTVVTAGSPYTITWNSFNNAGVNWEWTSIALSPPVVATPT